MAQHKPTDDAIARTLVENQLADVIERSDVTDLIHDQVMELAREIVGSFKFVEMDTTRSPVPGGQKIPLRRPVLTGEWEIDTNAGPRGED